MPQTKSSQQKTLANAWGYFHANPTCTTLAECGIARGTRVSKTEAASPTTSDIHLGQLRCGHLTTEGCMQCAWQAASDLCA